MHLSRILTPFLQQPLATKEVNIVIVMATKKNLPYVRASSGYCMDRRKTVLNLGPDFKETQAIEPGPLERTMQKG